MWLCHKKECIRRKRVTPCKERECGKKQPRQSLKARWKGGKKKDGRSEREKPTGGSWDTYPHWRPSSCAPRLPDSGQPDRVPVDRKQPPWTACLCCEWVKRVGGRSCVCWAHTGRRLVLPDEAPVRHRGGGEGGGGGRPANRVLYTPPTSSLLDPNLALTACAAASVVYIYGRATINLCTRVAGGFRGT